MSHSPRLSCALMRSSLVTDPARPCGAESAVKAKTPSAYANPVQTDFIACPPCSMPFVSWYSQTPHATRESRLLHRRPPSTLPRGFRRERGSMRNTPFAVLCCLVVWLFMPPEPADAGTIRIAVLKFGTVDWELNVIRAHGLDKSEGIDLQIIEA